MLVLICTNILDTEVDLINISFFSHPRGGIGRNVIIIVVDMSSSIKIDSKKKIIPGIGPTQELEDTLRADCVFLMSLKHNSQSI